MKTGLRVLLAGCGVWAGAAAGCNLIFGVSGGMTAGQGGAGAGGGTASGGAGGGHCNPYEGGGTTYLTDVATDGAAPNLPTLAVGNYGSVAGTYYQNQDYTEFKLGGDVSGYCGFGSILDLSGMPEVGAYTVVGTSPYDDASFSGGTQKNAYVFAGASPMLPDGGCDDDGPAFGSAGGSGTVNVTSVSGKRVTFTVTGVLANGISDPLCAGMGGPCDGTGTIQIDIKGGESDCFHD